MKRALIGLALVTAATGLFAACGGDSDRCAVRSENCSGQYLRDNNKTGCCAGLTCQDSAVTPGARVCR